MSRRTKVRGRIVQIAVAWEAIVTTVFLSQFDRDDRVPAGVQFATTCLMLAGVVGAVVAWRWAARKYPD